MNTPRPTWPLAAGALALTLAIGGCDESSSPSGSGAQSTLGKSAEFAKDVAGDVAMRDAQTAGMADAITGGSERIELAGLAWSIPSGWERSTPSSGMVSAELSVPGISSHNTRVKFFDGIGGSVQDNIDRWKRMVTYAGAPADARVDTQTLGGFRVTTIAMEGTYMEMVGGGASVRRDQFAFRGAVIEGTRGNIFITLAGPDEVIDEENGNWNRMIGSMQPN